MQKKKKIQKNDNLTKGIRESVDQNHKTRFEEILKKNTEKQSIVDENSVVRVKKNGSFKILEKLEEVKQILNTKKRVILIGDIASSEKAIKMLEMAKQSFGLIKDQIKIELSSKGEVKITIDC